MELTEVMTRIRSLGNPEAVAGMARFGINTENAYGVSIPNLRKLAKPLGRNHALAEQLWLTGIHEARLLACFIDDSKMVSENQMESWVKDIASWDLCDQCCSNLFDKSDIAYQKAVEWSEREEEFVKRAGFVLMATLSVHDKKADDARFETFLPIIRREACDERNFVKKAVNWALRQIGKRGPTLNRSAIEVAEEIKAMDSKAAKWIANDALRELTSPKVQARLTRRSPT
jgi:3-methyladenine DNA glycosylase AlkD